jgi:hypothetical protein
MTQSLYKNRFWLPLLAMFAVVLASCSNSWLPTEFKLKRVLYQTSDAHIVGPGGFNHSFTVYELPQDVAATISAKGLSYLNSLSTDAKTVPGYEGAPWWGPFSDWQATPVPSEKAWLRYGRDLEKDWKPSIKTFYVSWKGDNTKDGFISVIPLSFSDLFHEAISAPGNFYAYGDYRGMCLIVVSPKMGKVFYLFRD